VSRTLISEAADQLAAAGVASPRHDAEALAAYVLGVPRGRLALVDPAVFESARATYAAAVARRAAREPLQHVVGSAPFRRLELAVGPGVLIPRPESELLVDAVVAWLRAEDLPAARVVDLGTGTAALALAIADETAAAVWAVERDPAALAWASRNVEVTGPAVELVAGDMADALPELDGTVDVVVSNPPYLSLDLLPVLEPEVRDHDPAGALFAGTDPLAAIRTVESSARRLLRPGGLVVVEHADDQGESAPACFAGWHDVRDHLDLARRPRYLTAVHP
jgi:release factor glutamine methyltransferase